MQYNKRNSVFSLHPVCSLLRDSNIETIPRSLDSARLGSRSICKDYCSQLDLCLDVPWPGELMLTAYTWFSLLCWFGHLSCSLPHSPAPDPQSPLCSRDTHRPFVYQSLTALPFSWDLKVRQCCSTLLGKLGEAFGCGISDRGSVLNVSLE